MAKTKEELLRQRDLLKDKYTPEVYSKLRLEPEDVLQYVRDCTDFGRTANQRDFVEVNWHPLHQQGE